MATSGCWAARQPPVSACVSSFGEFGFSSAQALQKAFPVQISAPRPRGPATFAGTAGGQRTLSAPITGKECYVYRAIIWQQEPDDKAEWKSIAEETGYLNSPHRRLDRKNFGGTPRSRTRFATVLRAAIRSVRQGATAPRADCDFHVSQWSRSYPSDPRGRMLSNTVESRICYGNNDRYGNNVRISQPQPGPRLPNSGKPSTGTSSARRPRRPRSSAFPADPSRPRPRKCPSKPRSPPP